MTTAGVLTPTEKKKYLPTFTYRLDHGDGSYVWLAPAGSHHRSVGTISFEAKRLVFEATSQKCAEKVRDELPGLCGDAVILQCLNDLNVWNGPIPVMKSTFGKIP